MSIQGHTQGFVRVCKEATYWPEYTKNGKKVSARLLVPAMSENIGRKQEDGKREDRDPTYMEFTFWGGQANTYAKYLHVGKEFYCEFTMDSYFAKVFDKTRPDERGRAGLQHDANGKPLTKRTYSFAVIPGTVRLGKDGPKTIADEKSSGIRPIGYDGRIDITDLRTAIAGNQDVNAFLAQCEQGKIAWENHWQSWKKMEYTGGPKYGYANVRQPVGEGIVCAYDVNSAPAQNEAAGAATTVDGFTYEQMIAAGWTNEQLLTAEGGKYAILVPAAMKPAPTPPANIPAPPAAKQTTQSFESAGV
jgi:hypothetical protein